MIVKCDHCKLQENVAWLDTVPVQERFFYQCSKGCPPSGTGSDKRVRQLLEVQVPYNLPGTTAVRASALSKRIYNAAKSKSTEWVSLTKKTKKSLTDHGDAAKIIQQYPIYGRAWRGLSEDALVASVVVFENPGELPPYSIFVVFRGSVGDKNEGGAGFAGKSNKINIDWRTNFDNIQEYADYGGAGFLIHGGFKSSVGSYRDRVYSALAKALRNFPGAHVVITGHSQGAGHAVIFTHWLSYQAPQVMPGLFCMPFSPPRCGDYLFARDFNARIVHRTTVLPYDGMPPIGAMFVVKGHDPVSFNMEKAFAWKGDSQGHELSLRKWAGKGIVRGGLKAEHKEKKYGGDGLQVYFHPSCLKILKGKFIAKGKLQVLNHKPNWIRDQIRKDFEKSFK